MPIDTTNEKLALLELEDYHEPGIPLSPGVFDQGDQQQLLWGYPGILWASGAPTVLGDERLRLGTEPGAGVTSQPMLGGWAG